MRGWLRRAAGRLEAVRTVFLQNAVTAGVDVQIPTSAGSGWGGSGRGGDGGRRVVVDEIRGDADLGWAVVGAGRGGGLRWSAFVAGLAGPGDRWRRNTS